MNQLVQNTSKDNIGQSQSTFQSQTSQPGQALMGSLLNQSQPQQQQGGNPSWIDETLRWQYQNNQPSANKPATNNNNWTNDVLNWQFQNNQSSTTAQQQSPSVTKDALNWQLQNNNQTSPSPSKQAQQQNNNNWTNDVRCV